MAECSVDTLISEGRCFSGACLTPDQQRIAMLQLLCQIAETSGGGVDSILAGNGISVDSPTGVVTITNTGVLSLIAGTGISLSGATGNVTARFTPSQYTTAQLLAMSSGDATAVGIAYCTDCITTNGILTEVGGMVRWSGLGWVTFIDNVAPTTSFNEFCIHLFRRNFNSNTIPGSTRFTQLATGNFNSGAGASISSSTGNTNNGQINLIGASTGTTATGIASFRFNGFDTDPTNWNSRAIGMVLNHVTVEQSTVGQTFSYRSGVSTYSAATVSALQSDEVCLVYDPNNTLGAGINTDNWWYLVRANGTTLYTGDTGIARTTPIWTCATIVPVSGNTVIAQVATALNGGSSYTVHVNQSVTFSASPASATLCLAKATGTTAKTANRQHNPKMFAARMNNLTPTTVVY